jgi:hypothetical protein
MTARRRRSSSLNSIRRPLQLRLQHAVLFAEEFDDVALLSFEPAEQRREHQVEENHCLFKRTNPFTQFDERLRAELGVGHFTTAKQ